MECGKKIPLGQKVIEKWKIKKYIGVTLGLEAEMETFH